MTPMEKDGMSVGDRVRVTAGAFAGRVGRIDGDDGDMAPPVVFEGDPLERDSWGYVSLDDLELETVKPEADLVNHPPHYKALGFEVIDIAEKLNFCLGNAVKYILRADFKHDDDGEEDLAKAEWYIARERERRKALRETVSA